MNYRHPHDIVLAVNASDHISYYFRWSDGCSNLINKHGVYSLMDFCFRIHFKRHSWPHCHLIFRLQHRFLIDSLDGSSRLGTKKRDPLHCHPHSEKRYYWCVWGISRSCALLSPLSPAINSENPPIPRQADWSCRFHTFFILSWTRSTSLSRQISLVNVSFATIFVSLWRQRMMAGPRLHGSVGGCSIERRFAVRLIVGGESNCGYILSENLLYIGWSETGSIIEKSMLGCVEPFIFSPM